MRSNSLKLKVLIRLIKNKTILLPKMTNTPSDTNFYFQLKRIQFPIILSFCTIIKKSKVKLLKLFELN